MTSASESVSEQYTKMMNAVVVVVVAATVCATKVLPFLQPSSASVAALHEEVDEQSNVLVGLEIGPISVLMVNVNADVSDLQ
jgi:hypothetical protein